MVNVYARVPAEVDMRETELQLNNYRVKLAKFSIVITRMMVQVFVRDGGLAVASSRGIERNSYLIPVAFLSNDVVTNYFSKKEHNLAMAMAAKSWTEPCSNEECWDGAKCKDYCDVAMFCPKGSILSRQP